MKKLAVVPYDIDKSYDFYDDRLIVDGRTIEYDEIQGYGYLLTHKSNSVNLIPVSNSTTFTVYLDLGNEIFQFGRYANGAMSFKTNKQKTIDLIFSEVYKCLEILIAPQVFSKCKDVLRSNGELKIGSLTITRHEIIKKSTFGTKSLPLSEYLQTTVGQGMVKVYGQNNKMFFSCALSVINAPLIGPMLNGLTNKG